MHHLPRLWMIVVPALILVVCGVELLASTAVLNMRDGRVIRAELIDETQDAFVVRIAGIRTEINKTDVQSHEIIQTPEQDFQNRRAELADDDIEGRYSLAYEFFELREYDIAQQELQSLMQDFEEDERVELLLRIVQERKKLQEEARQRAEEGRTPPEQETPRVPAEIIPDPDQSVELPRLTEKDINVIKIWELPDDFATELRPNITIPPDVMRDVLRRYADDQNIPKGRAEQQRFLRRPGYEQLKTLFDLRAQEYYSEAIMRGDPPTMTEFRRQINPQYIVRYFARHFGDGQVPGLYLITDNATSEVNAYTNFYILSQFRYEGRQMIDRLQPENSLLLQWGLARELAQYPAPDIPGWQPRFRTMSDPMYDTVLNWIRSLYRNADYGIRYQMPRAQQEDADANAEQDN